jgi:hypothetical protein
MMEDGWDEGPLVNDTAFERISQSLRELNHTLSTANVRPFDKPMTEASMFPPALKPVALAGTTWPLSGLATLEDSNLELLCRTYPLACCSLALGSSQSPEVNPQAVDSVASHLIIALCASPAVLTCDGLLRQALRVPCEEAGNLRVYVQLLSLFGQGTRAGGEEAADEELRESYISMCALIVCGTHITAINANNTTKSTNTRITITMATTDTTINHNHCQYHHHNSIRLQ